MQRPAEGQTPPRQPLAVVFRIRLFRPSETFIVDQARAVRPHAVRLLGREADQPTPAGLDYRVAPAAGRWSRSRDQVFGADGFYRRALAEWQPAVLHAHFGVDAVAVMQAAARADVPLVTTLHGYDVTTRNSRLLASASPTLVRYALRRRRLAEQGRVFICVSDFIRERALALGFPEAKVVKHYIGTDLARFVAVDRHYADRAPIVLHTARLVEKKGTGDLLRAFVEVRRRVPEARLVVIGDGPLREPLERQASDTLPAGTARFLGTQPHGDVLQWLAASAVFCLPSVTATNGDTEGLPISIVEAMAAGLPVAATRHSGIPEAIEHGVTGLLVAEHDVPALADALVQLLRDDALAARLAEGGRRRAHERFDIARQGAELGRLYDRAAS